MTDNEKIARWRGPFIEVSMGNKGISPLGTLGIIDGHTSIVGPRRWLAWRPDTDIALWHGEGGLLTEIEKRGHNRAVMFVFYLRDVLKMEKGETNFWKYMTASPAQLAAALVKMIEEGK